MMDLVWNPEDSSCIYILGFRLMMDLVWNPEDDSCIYILGSVNDGSGMEP